MGYLPAVYVYICTYIYTHTQNNQGVSHALTVDAHTHEQMCRKILKTIVYVLHQTPRQPNGWLSIYTRAQHS